MHAISRAFVAFGFLAASMIACNLGAQQPTPTPVVPPTLIRPPVVVATLTPAVTLTATRAGVVAVNTIAPAVPANCTVRTDWFAYTVQAGDTLGTIATRSSTTVANLQAGNCLANANVIAVGQRIYTPTQVRVLPTATPIPPTAIVVLPTATSTLTNSGGCTIGWFFIPANPTAVGCPTSQIFAIAAAGQEFQNGRMLYYAPNANVGFSSGVVMVLYPNGTFEQYPDTFNGNVEPPSDPSIVPPTGLVQPVRAIGKVWRSYPKVREALGFGLADEVNFNGRVQVAGALFALDSGNRQVIRILQNGTWTVIGNY